MQNNLKDWVVLEEKRILQTELFDLYEQKLEGRSGELRTYTVVKRRPTVSVVPLTEDNEIYIVGQERYLLNRFCWEIMAGFVNAGENPLEAAKRELKEETGLTGKIWKKLGELEMSATAIKGTSHLYIAKDLMLGEAKPDVGEYITVKKLPLAKAVEMVINGEFVSAVSTAAILLVDKLLQLKKI